MQPPPDAGVASLGCLIASASVRKVHAGSQLWCARLLLKASLFAGRACRRFIRGGMVHRHLNATSPTFFEFGRPERYLPKARWGKSTSALAGERCTAGSPCVSYRCIWLMPIWADLPQCLGKGSGNQPFLPGR